MNQSSIITGVPGSGKSLFAKQMMLPLVLNSEDDVMICDPEGEYARMLERFNDIVTVVHIAAGGKDRLNAMYMVDSYGENNPTVTKAEFIMSLIEQIDKKESARSTSPSSTAVSLPFTGSPRNWERYRRLPHCVKSSSLNRSERRSRLPWRWNCIRQDLWISSASTAMWT